ncbi:MAG: hypothetical protein N4A57_17050 [Anaeromicrobium sp.]|jgi:hypothetical protein|uniref:hypothetical protein n=1 Tax=Anaeromicrobium sp. TaxID=1929132 RepID=UPI0025FA9796|nr:hypothetical protein [Anaeromicrobium sp.]MCT4595956.1 hypothetical protein [Anaeromicrobium sp.]
MNRKKLLKIALLIMCVVLIIFGVIYMAKLKDKNIISKSELFEEKYKKLEPHLEIISGCVKVNYEGEGKKLKSVYEIWENGKVKNTGSLMEIDFDKELYGEFSISLKEFYDDNDSEFKMITVFSQDEGNTTSIQFIPEFESGLYSEIEKMQKDKDIELGKEIPIWLLYAHEEENFQNSDSMDEYAKKSKWALEIKLIME